MRLEMRRAIVSKNYDRVTSLLANGFSDFNSMLPEDPEDRPFEHSDLPLKLAVETKDIKMVQLLVDNGANPDVCDYDGKNVLWTIISKIQYAHNTEDFNNTMRILDYLVSKGMDVHNKSHSGGDVIDEALQIRFACEKDGRLDQYHTLINFLEAKRSIATEKPSTVKDPFEIDSLGRNYLLVYADAQNWKSCKEQIEAGSDINHADNRGNTVVHRFTGWGDNFEQSAEAIDFVEFLIKSGANLDIKNNNGDTPLERACNMNTWKLARMLIDAGVNPDSVLPHLQSISGFNEGARSLLSYIKSPPPVSSIGMDSVVSEKKQGFFKRLFGR